MDVVIKCCFYLSLEHAVLLIGFVSMVTHSSRIISFTGLLSSTSFILHVFVDPEDALLQALLRVFFCVGVPGVIFHTILFIVSTVLLCGAMTRVPPLMIPWMGWSPFVFSGLLVKLVLISSQKPDLALPLTSCTLMALLFLVYATLIVATYYRDILSATVQLRIYNLQQGELPRIVKVPWRLATRINRIANDTRIRDGTPTAGSSARPLRMESGYFSDMRSRLQSAYGRFIAASQLNRRNAANVPPERH